MMKTIATTSNKNLKKPLCLESVSSVRNGGLGVLSP